MRLLVICTALDREHNLNCVYNCYAEFKYFFEIKPMAAVRTEQSSVEVLCSKVIQNFLYQYFKGSSKKEIYMGKSKKIACREF